MLAIASIAFVSCEKDEDPIVTPGAGSSFVPNPSQFEGNINDGIVTLDASKTYDLTGALVVKSGATLVIPAGTVIKASGGTSSYIAVAQGAKIMVNGTASNPVVMTSAKSSPQPGDWGGLVLCGKAPTNKGATATAEVSDLTYGGTDTNDSSGSIRFLRIEYTGATFNGSKEFNGVSLFGVGAGTTFEYVQSLNGGDDGIEFFGGTVKGKYLVSTGSGDDSIDFADGWSGTGEFWYISKGAKAGIEGSNNGDNGDATPMTNATLKNITLVGPGSEGALYIKEGGGKWNLSNINISKFALGVKIKSDDAPANTRVKNGDIKINQVQFDGTVTTKNEYKGTETFITETTSATGAGNGGGIPTWTAGWTKGL